MESQTPANASEAVSAGVCEGAYQGHGLVPPLSTLQQQQSWRVSAAVRGSSGVSPGIGAELERQRRRTRLYIGVSPGIGAELERQRRCTRLYSGVSPDLGVELARQRRCTRLPSSPAGASAPLHAAPQRRQPCWRVSAAARGSPAASAPT